MTLRNINLVSRLVTKTTQLQHKAAQTLKGAQEAATKIREKAEEDAARIGKQKKCSGGKGACIGFKGASFRCTGRPN